MKRRKKTEIEERKIKRLKVKKEKEEQARKRKLQKICKLDAKKKKVPKPKTQGLTQQETGIDIGNEAEDEEINDLNIKYTNRLSKIVKASEMMEFLEEEDE